MVKQRGHLRLQLELGWRPSAADPLAKQGRPELGSPLSNHPLLLVRATRAAMALQSEVWRQLRSQQKHLDLV